MPTPPPTEALLCERCGYEMSPLGVDHLCPECGRNLRVDVTARLSDPDGDGGSVLEMLRSPHCQFLAVPMRMPSANDRMRSTLHRAAVVIAAPQCIAVPFFLVYIVFQRVGSLGAWVALFVAFILANLWGLAAYSTARGTLRALCWIEEQGVQFFGARRGWRVTPVVARAVIARAASGWVAGAWASALGWLIGAVLMATGQLKLAGPLDQYLWFLSLPVAGLFLGLLIFESLVYIGIRACRFANSPAVVSRFMPGFGDEIPGVQTVAGAHDALLCERCGYDMSSLGLAHRCPECGANLAADVAARIGSPAQRLSGRTWLRSCTWILRRPRGAFGTIKIESVHTFTLYELVLARAAVLVATPPFLVAVGVLVVELSSSWSASKGMNAFLFLVMFAVVLLGYLVLFLAVQGFLRQYCLLRVWRAQFSGRRRGWRVTSAVGRSVIAHAAVGWFVGAVGWCVGWAVSAVGLLWLRPVSLVADDILVRALLVLPFVGPFLGFLTFELLVYIGIRACRFSNPPAVVARYLPLDENPSLRATPAPSAE